MPSTGINLLARQELHERDDAVSRRAEGGQLPLLRGPAAREGDDAASIATDPDVRQAPSGWCGSGGVSKSPVALSHSRIWLTVMRDDEPAVRGEPGQANEARVAHRRADRFARLGVPDARQRIGSGGQEASAVGTERQAREIAVRAGDRDHAARIDLINPGFAGKGAWEMDSQPPPVGTERRQRVVNRRRLWRPG